jgi:protein-S-isoprenylcysteine O-methyltransferase Ste14
MRVTIAAGTLLAMAFALGGMLVILMGLIEFRRAGTTVDPMHPDKASSLVVGHVYALTRNPMYLGLAIMLLGWAIFLSHPFSFLVLPCFIAYMNRFQIVPEEKTLEMRFGAAFRQYADQVGRWL